VEYGEAAVRGLAIHARLRELHEREPRRPCAPDEVPEPVDGWSAGGWQVNAGEARLGVQMLGDHWLVCPLRDLEPTAQAQPERVLVAYDPWACVVVVAKVDLVVHGRDGRRIREVKTTRIGSSTGLLSQYPQIAVDLLLLKAGAAGSPGAADRVEVEQLTERGPVVVGFPVNEPAVVRAARKTAFQHITQWHADTEFSPKNRKLNCEDCGHARWCAVKDLSGTQTIPASEMPVEDRDGEAE